MMIMVPDFVGVELYEAALAKARTKLGQPPGTLRLESLTEGLSLQTLHIGSYDDEGPILAHLHDGLMPAENLDFNGRHHEIYLSDPRKTPPGKLKTMGALLRAMAGHQPSRRGKGETGAKISRKRQCGRRYSDAK